MTRKSSAPALTLLLIVLLCSRAVGATTQRPDDARERIEKVKAAVTRLGVGHRARVKVELRNLMRLKGFILQTGADAFYVVITEGGPIGSSVTVDYGEVTSLRGRGVALDFKGLSWQGIGTWDAVRELERGTALAVSLTDGRVVSGLLYACADGFLTVLHAGDEIECRREEVSLVMRWLGEPSSLFDEVAGGTLKGVRVSDKVGRSLPPIRGPISGEVGQRGRGATATGAALGAGIGAGVGLIKHGFNRGRRKGVIVYSK